MIERIKTFVLLILVLSSAGLTWKLWTYQPEYDYVLPTQFVTHEGLAERKELTDLVRPERVIFHYDEQKTTVANHDMTTRVYLFSEMSEWIFEQFEEVDARDYLSIQEQMRRSPGIEFQFAAGLPLEVLEELYEVQTGFLSLPPINRIWLHRAEDGQMISAVFISEEEQQMFRSQTDLDAEQFERFLIRGSTQPEHRAFVFDEPKEESIYTVHYLPEEETALTEYRYFVRSIPINVMISYLFLDPTLVSPIEDQEKGTFYTDGTRGLQYHQRQMTIHFFHPQVHHHGQLPASQNDYVHNSIQFVNQHKGWDADYALDRIEKNVLDQHVHIEYRQFQTDDGVSYPVYSETAEQEQHVLRLDVQGERVVGYYRPLVEKDQKMNAGSKKMLPSGPALVQYLKNEQIPFDDIERLFIGYKGQMSDHYMLYEPHWIIELIDGRRLFLQNIPDTGGGQA